jgi:hypothetical protein
MAAQLYRQMQLQLSGRQKEKAVALRRRHRSVESESVIAEA